MKSWSVVSKFLQRLLYQYTWLVVAALAVGHAVLAVDCAGRTSVTHDEFWHLPVGLLHWHTGRFDFDRLNPPLVRLWAALPLLATDARVRTDPTDLLGFGDMFLQLNARHYHKLFQLARCMIVLLSVGTGLLLALWAQCLYGRPAACLAALLWFADPTVLAHGSLVTTDVGAAFFFMLTLYAAWQWSRQPSWKRAVWFGLCLGAAQLAKYTCVLLVPLSIALWLIWRFLLNASSGVKNTPATSQASQPQPLSQSLFQAQQVQALSQSHSPTQASQNQRAAQPSKPSSHQRKAHRQGSHNPEPGKPEVNKSKALNLEPDTNKSVLDKSELDESEPDNSKLHQPNSHRRSTLHKRKKPRPKEPASLNVSEQHTVVEQHVGGEAKEQKQLKRDGWQWATVLVVSVLVVNVGYLFQGTGERLGAFRFRSRAARLTAAALSPLSWVPVPLPRDYVLGLDAQLHVMEGQHPVFLDGQWSTHGFRSYYVKTLVYKLPHAVHLMVLLALLSLLERTESSLQRRRALWVLIPFVVLLALASFSNMQLGIRYVLPALPFLYLFAAQAAVAGGNAEGSRRNVFFGALAVGVLLSVSALRFHPHHLAYFNELAGGPLLGRWHLLDSNLDWGQDLDRLARYLSEHGNSEIGLAYFGTVPPARLGIHYHLPPTFRPRPGRYAVSVNLLMGRPYAVRAPDGRLVPCGLEAFGYFRFFEPVAHVGYSIDVFELTAADVARWQKVEAEAAQTP